MKRDPIFWTRLRDRGGGMLFALALNALLVLALLTLAPHLDAPGEEERNPVTFDLAAAPEAEKAKEEEAEQKGEEKEQPEEEKKEEVEETKPVEPVEKPPEPTPKPVRTPPIVRLPFIEMSRDQMASSDIARMPKGAPAATADAGGAATAAGGGAKAGPGEGPGGVQLFEAEWYRRPTQAELATYMPTDAPVSGWGLVACKTVENYRVENCQALGESPMGSGLARAVRLAAWQFMVRPPRVNGKPMVGSWVRIRIDYSRRPADAGGAGS